MPPQFRVLPGLPAVGAPATAIPSEWGARGREGFVVEFATGSGSWTANFKPGLGGLNSVFSHPNDRDVIVVASGDLWFVDPETRQAQELLHGVNEDWGIPTEHAWILSRQGLALVSDRQEGARLAYQKAVVGRI